MKLSKLYRKELNALRALDEIPWPARQYKIPPTFGRAAAKQFHVGTCERPIGEAQVKRGRLRRKQTVAVPCGGKLIARLGSGTRRRVYCESCRGRKAEARRLQKLERRVARLGGLTLREEARESRRRFSVLAKFRRSGVR